MDLNKGNAGFKIHTNMFYMRYKDTYKYVLYEQWCVYLVCIIRTYMYNTAQDYIQYIQNHNVYNTTYIYTDTKIRTIIRTEYV